MPNSTTLPILRARSVQAGRRKMSRIAKLMYHHVSLSVGVPNMSAKPRKSIRKYRNPLKTPSPPYTESAVWSETAKPSSAKGM